MGTTDKVVAILLSVAMTAVLADTYGHLIAAKIVKLASVVAGH